MLCYNRPHVLHARIAQFNRVAVYKTSVSVTTWEVFLNETEELYVLLILLLSLLVLRCNETFVAKLTCFTEPMWNFRINW